MTAQFPDANHGDTAGPREPSAELARSLQAVNQLWREGSLDAAEAGLRAVLNQMPGEPYALQLLGVLRAERGDPQEAERLLRKVTDPAFHTAEFYQNIARVLEMNGLVSEAGGAWQEALACDPSNTEAHRQLGRILESLGHRATAVTHLDKVIEHNPEDALSHYYRGVALFGLDSHDEALCAYQRASKLDPENPTPELASTGPLLAMHRYAEALAAARRACEKAPEDASVHNNLGHILLQTGQVSEAVSELRKALARNPHDARARSNYLLSLNYILDYDESSIFFEHRQWSHYHTRATRPFSFSNIAKPERRLRIGYLSADFREHSVSRFFAPLLEHHDQSTVEPYCLFHGTRPDSITARLRRAAAGWIELRELDDDDAAEKIAKNEIDILVELSGHTGQARPGIVANKPAPLQVNWLGYPRTTGLEAVDAKLLDPILAQAPELGGEQFIEEIVTLPSTSLCFEIPPEAPPVRRPPFRANGYITFGSFNNVPKLNERVIACWAKILHQTAHSRLVLKALSLKDEETCARFRSAFERHGIDPSRIEMRFWDPDRSTHLDRYNEIDIALDPFPYNGVTTTCEALSMGVPVIALAGRCVAGLHGQMILSTIQANDLIATDEEDYVARAVSLAASPEALASWRSRLRGCLAASPLCDPVRFAANMERVYRRLWRQWCDAPKPGDAAKGEDPSARPGA